MIKILLGIAVGYGFLYLVVPPGNFMYDSLRLPFWLLKIQRLSKSKQRPTKLKYGKHFRQYLLHYPAAEGVALKRHIVIYIHGSGWQFGRPEMFNANGQWLAQQGFHAFFLSHRRIPQCNIKDIREDTRMAIEAVLNEMGRLGIANQKILLCGNSAGGNLAALAMFDGSLMAQAGISTKIFSALALFAAPLDLSVMWPSPPLLMLTKMRRHEEFCLANPICHLNAAVDIPVLLIHGNKDGICEYENTVVFHEKLLALGSTDVRFETLENGMHLDSASWCILGHLSCEIFGKWLEKIENQ